MLPYLKHMNWRPFALAVSGLVCAVISLCLLVQPDWLAAIVLVPSWCWLIVGLLLNALGYTHHCKRWSAVVLTIWGVFTWSFVEEVHSLLRFKNWPKDAWQGAREDGDRIRVVSLNCNTEATKIVDDIATRKPDVVLLQESPGENDLDVLCNALFGDNGSFLNGGDVAILSRGNIRSKFRKLSSHFMYVELLLPSGVRVNTVSLRLTPPVFRLDFWMPGFWDDHRDKRIQHRRQIHEIMKHIQKLPTTEHWIVGGDFNAPPYDDALSPLEPKLFDTFSKAGRGWGATATNNYPLFRVDQIWVSQNLTAESVTSHKNRYSDHRMVVCDLTVNE